MSLDRSLKSSSNMAQHRNVLTRAERSEKLKERGGFDPATSRILGLPKVANRKVSTGKKEAKKADAAAPAAGAAAPAAGKATPAAKAPAAKAGGKK